MIKSIIYVFMVILLGCTKASKPLPYQYYSNNYPLADNSTAIDQTAQSREKNNLSNTAMNSLSENSDNDITDAETLDTVADIPSGSTLDPISDSEQVQSIDPDSIASNPMPNDITNDQDLSAKTDDTLTLAEPNSDLNAANVANVDDATSDNISLGAINDISFDLNLSSTEERLLSAVINSFNNRDKLKFFTLSSEFISAYPNSIYQGRVMRLQQEFYQNSTSFRQLLKDQAVQFSDLNFISWADWQAQLQNLRFLGVNNLIFTPFQHFGENTVPFDEQANPVGALFKTKTIPMVNDALQNVATTSNLLNMKLLVRMPVRYHDWLKIGHSWLMDQTWDKVIEKGIYNNKLNIFHPKALEYFKQIIDQLANYDIEGFIFADDYDLQFNEGYSTFNKIVYNNQTKNDISVDDIPANFWQENWNLKSNAHDLGSATRFSQFQNWRVSNHHLFMLQLVRYIRNKHPTLKIGIEVWPQLILNPKQSLYESGVSIVQIIGLSPDFMILNKQPNIKNSDYDRAIAKFNILDTGIDLVLRVEYEDSGFENLNKAVNYIKGQFNDVQNWQFIFGPKVPADDWILLTKN